MCGLSGVVGTISYSGKEFDVFKNLMYFNMVRGEDSTGVGILPRYSGQDMRTVKVLGPACDLINTDKFKKSMNTGFHLGWLGHNRSATAGGINIRNAHPFQFESIMGMHNGTIETHARNKMTDHNQYGTDSEALIFNIQKHGVENIIPKLEGSWTLVWYNDSNLTINFLRNEKRPLAYVFSKDRKRMFFASELDTLAGALRRNEVEWATDKFSVLPVNVWYSWQIPKLNEEFGEPKRQTVEGFKYVAPLVNHSTYSARKAGEVSSITTPGFTQGQLPVHIPSQTTNVSNSYGTPSTVIGRPSPANDTTKDPDWKPDPDACKGLYAWMNLKFNRVYRNSKMNTWIHASWSQDNKNWSLREMRQAPKFLQFSWLDVNANHAFQHIGKKKNKVIFYKGFRGTLLDRLEFENVTKCGCASCGRTDVRWGNPVLFVSNIQFLCEFCSMDAPLVKSWFGHTTPTQQAAAPTIN